MLKRRKLKSKTRVLYLLAIPVFLVMGVGYSYLNSSLGVSGNTIFAASSWDIAFENLTVKEGSVTNATITPNGTNLNVTANLKNPGEFYSFTIDLSNKGTVNAMISDVEQTVLTEEQQKYLIYSVTYEDGTAIKVNDKIGQKTTKRILVNIKYRDDVASYLYPETQQVVTYNFSLKFSQPKVFKVAYTQNGRTENYETEKNTDTITIKDVTFKETEKVIKCNNGVKATYSDNKVVISNIKSDASCSVYNSLKSSIEGSDTTTNNITMINNENSSDTITVEEHQEFVIDLNGKTNTTTYTTDTSYITNKGHLVVYDSVGEGALQTNSAIFSNYGVLELNSGNYVRKDDSKTLDSSKGGVVRQFNKRVHVRNSNLHSDDTLLLSIGATDDENSEIVIENSTLTSDNGGCLSNRKGTISIYNSTVKGKNRVLASSADDVSNMYVCNSTIQRTEDVEIQALGNHNVFYSSNSVFTDGGHTPAKEGENIYREDNLTCKRLR